MQPRLQTVVESGTWTTQIKATYPTEPKLGTGSSETSTTQGQRSRQIPPPQLRPAAHQRYVHKAGRGRAKLTPLKLATQEWSQQSRPGAESALRSASSCQEPAKQSRGRGRGGAASGRNTQVPNPEAKGPVAEAAAHHHHHSPPGHAGLRQAGLPSRRLPPAQGKSCAEGKARLPPGAGAARATVAVGVSDGSLAWKMPSRSRTRLTAREEKAYKARLVTTTGQ